MSGTVVVLGVFNADTTYRATRLPRMGETIHGTAFALGPGGKGANQAVAAAKAGGETHFITRLGADTFADTAHAMWAEAGVIPAATIDADQNTGAALIFVEDGSGDNCIVIAPGAASKMDESDVNSRVELIEKADVFVTQLEQPLAAARRGLEVARAGGTITVFNPAPAMDLSDAVLALCDYITPNETEAETLTGIAVSDLATAEAAGRALIARGCGAAVMTLGGDGALLVDAHGVTHVPAMAVGDVVETTGAGDAFNGGFAVGLAEGLVARDAARFASAVAGISVTRPGAAPSMPTRTEIDAALRDA